MKHRLFCEFLLLAGFFAVWGLGLYYAGAAVENFGRFSIYYPESTIVPKDFMPAAENAKLKVRLINYSEKETVACGIKNEEAVLTVAEVYSSMVDTLAIPISAGEKLFSNDFDGCLVDKKSAFRIFGTARAVGNELIWKGKKYIVRGIADSRVPLLVVNESDKNHSFQNAELVFPKKNDPDREDNKLQADAARQFILINRLSEPETVVDYGLAGAFMDWMIKFPAYLILLWFILSKIGKWYKKWKSYYLGYKKEGRLTRKKHIIKAFLLAGGLIAGYLASVYVLLMAGGLNLKIPLKFFPNGWSNLKSYDNAIKEMADGIAALGNVRLYFNDLALRKSTYACIFCIGAAIVLLAAYLAVSRAGTKPAIGKGTFLRPMITVLIILAVSLLLYRLNFIFRAPGYYLMLMPAFMALEELEGLFYIIGLRCQKSTY